MTIEGSSSKEINDFKKEIITHTQSPSIVGAPSKEIESATYEDYRSMVDLVDKANKLRKKYNFILVKQPDDSQYLEVIKMLEVKLFSAEASLKLAMELIKQMEIENKEFRKWNKPLND